MIWTPQKMKPRLGSRIDWGHRLAQGLVGCWLMNEGGGTKIYDISNNGGNSSSIHDFAFAPAKYGSGLHYGAGASNQEVEFSNDYKPLDGCAAFTIKLLCKPTTAIASDYGLFYTDIHATNEPIAWWIDNGSPDRIGVVVTASGGTTDVDYGSATITAGIWYDFALTWDGTTVRLYIDGVEDTGFDGSGATGTLDASGSQYHIGNDTNLSRDFIGTFDHCYIWSRALTASEITQLYINPFCFIYRNDWIVLAGGTQKYTRGDYAALPADDTDLENAFTGGEYAQVKSDDADRAAQTATDEFAIFEFKDYAGDNTTLDVTWDGQSDLAPSSSTVYLQIYNQNTTTWETLDSDSATVANTDFELTGSKADLTNYKDGNDYVSCRVYQEAK
jgi:hypothetical protein